MTSATARSRAVSLVLDASAAVELVLGRPGLARLLLGEELHVPAHFDVEVVAALRGVQIRGEASTEDVERARNAFRQLVVVRHWATLLVDRAWDLRDAITIQDGAYVALAEGLGCALVTTDVRLERSASGLVPIVTPDS